MARLDCNMLWQAGWSWCWQNAMRATVEHYPEASEVPKLQVLICKGVEDLSIKVSSCSCSTSLWYQLRNGSTGWKRVNQDWFFVVGFHVIYHFLFIIIVPCYLPFLCSLLAFTILLVVESSKGTVSFWCNFKCFDVHDLPDGLLFWQLSDMSPDWTSKGRDWPWVGSSPAIFFFSWQLSDMGGGIPRSRLDLLFQYMYSTAPEPSRSDCVSAPLAGYGYGLPLSRLYARYFHGDLVINSVEGYGTDAHIFLKVSRMKMSLRAVNWLYWRCMLHFRGEWCSPGVCCSCMQEMWTCPSGVAVEGASGTLVAAAGIICGTFGIMHTLWGSLYEIFVL